MQKPWVKDLIGGELEKLKGQSVVMKIKISFVKDTKKTEEENNFDCLRCS